MPLCQRLGYYVIRKRISRDPSITASKACTELPRLWFATEQLAIEAARDFVKTDTTIGTLPSASVYEVD